MTDEELKKEIQSRIFSGEGLSTGIGSYYKGWNAALEMVLELMI